MGSIIGSFGRVKPVLIITLCDLQNDGTVINIDYEFDYNSTYEIVSFNPVNGLLYTHIGKLNSFGRDPIKCPCDKNEVDWIVIDKSRDKDSKIVRLFIKDIKSIREIENFE